MKILDRIKAPRPKFWVKVGKVGVALTIVGSVLVTPLPMVGGVLLTAGATIKSISHLAIEDNGQINN
jgi:hypothetical protein